MRYGRCMSKKDALNLKKSGILLDSDSGYVSVFDCPRFIEKKLEKMGGSEIKNYFRFIGVRCTERVVLFDVNISTDKIVGPIAQRNGLREYKIPEGTKVMYYKEFNL